MTDASPVGSVESMMHQAHLQAQKAQIHIQQLQQQQKGGTSASPLISKSSGSNRKALATKVTESPLVTLPVGKGANSISVATPAPSNAGSGSLLSGQPSTTKKGKHTRGGSTASSKGMGTRSSAGH